MFLRSREELRSYEAIRAHSVQEMLSNKRRSTLDGKQEGLMVNVLGLPFEPVWYIPLMIISALIVLLVIFEAAPYTLDWTNNIKLLLYIFDLMYAVDVILMIMCKLVRLSSAPVIRPTSRPKLILIIELMSVLPIELFATKGSEEYRMLRLNRMLRIPRLFHHLYYKHSMVKINTWLKVVMFFFLICVFIAVYYTTIYYLYCKFGVCGKTKFYSMSILLSCTAMLTNHGLAEEPRSKLVWPISAIIVSYSCFYMIFGVCLAYIINDFTRSQSHKYKFKNGIVAMHEQFVNMNLPSEIIDVCTDFYNIFWRNRHGFNDDMSFFEMIPAPMYQQVVLDVCWIPLKHSKLLKNMDQPFLRFLSTFVQQKFMLKGQLVYQKNHLKKKMIYIATGVVQIISEQDGDTPIMSFSAGTCIGESSLIISYKSRNTVRCKDYCEVQVLSKRDFIRAIKKYPDRFKHLRRQINKRYDEAKELNVLSKHFNEASEAEGKDYFTITWIKNTLHKLMAKDDENKSKHEYQNIYLRYEMHEHKIHSMLFSAKYLDMLVITERLELDSDRIFLKTGWPFILQPDSPFIVFWERVIFTCAAITAILIPKYAFDETKIPMGISVWFVFVTFVYIIDFLLQIFTAVKTKDELVTSIKGIFAHKLQHFGFIMDILAMVPVEFFSSICFRQLNDQDQAILMINRIFKIWRIFRTFDVWENQLHSNIMLIAWVKFVCLILYLIFLLSCILSAFNCRLYNDCNIYKGEYRSIYVAAQMVTGIGLASGWDRKYNYNVIYFVTMNLCCIIILLMYVTFSAAYILEHHSLLQIQKLATNFDIIAKTKKISHQDRTMKYILTQWLDNRGTKIMSTRSKTADMPRHLFKVMREAAYAEILRKQAFFKGLDDYILTDICVIVKQIVLPANEIVAYAGDLSQDFYIIIKGFCTDYTYGRKLKPGDSFNIMESCLGLPVLQTVVTVTYCKLISIPYQKMKQIYATHQNFEKEVSNTIDSCANIINNIRKFVTNVDKRWYDVPEMTDGKSFYKFPKIMELHSKEEYEYYVPFDKEYFFGWAKSFLMKTTIYPEGKFMMFWESLRSVFAIITSVLCVTPYISACPARVCFWAYLFYFLDLTAIVDIYVRMHICYYNELGILVVHPLCTAKHYMSHGFFFDLLGVLPFNYLLPFDSIEWYKRRLYAHCNRLIQMHRYIQLKSSWYFSRLIPLPKLYVFGYFPIILVWISIGASVLLMNTCQFHHSIPASEQYTTGFSCSTTSWLSYRSFTIPITIEEAIVYSWVFSASLVTTIGVQSIEIRDMRVGLYCAIMSVVCVFFITYIMANIISHFSSSSPVMLAYQEAMKSLKGFMVVKKVPRALQKKIIDHYELKWSREKGKNINVLIKKFHFPLKQDLLFYLYGKKIFENSSFGNKSKGFYRNIIMRTSHTSMLKGSIVLSINDINKYLYIVYSGMVNIVAADGTILDSVTEGAMIGNLDGLPYTRQTANLVALSHVELLSIESTDFFQVLEKYTELKHEFRFKSVCHVYHFPGKNAAVNEAFSSEEPTFGIFALNPADPRIKVFFWLSLHTSCFASICLEMYQFAVNEFHFSFVVFQYAFDAFFFIYIFIKYFMAYEDEMGHIITDTRRIVKYHLLIAQRKWRLCMDGFSLIPLDFIFFLKGNYVNSQTFKYLRSNRLCRLMNIIEFFGYKNELLATNHTLNTLEFVLIWTVLLLQGSTCVLLYVCCQSKWKNMLPHLDCTTLDSSTKRFRAYVNYMYNVVNMFTRSAQLGFRPNAPFTACFLIVIMMLMSILVAVFFSQIFLVVYKNYFTRIAFAKKVDRLNHYTEREEVSSVLVDRIQVYVQRLWMRHRGVLYPQLLETAPRYLSEAILNASYSDHILNHPIFFKCHVDFQRQIVSQLRDNIYFPGDYIAFQEDMIDSMFFIHRGEVVASTETEGKIQKVFRTYKQGQVFGVLQGLTSGIPYKHSFRAVTVSVVLTLNYKSWSHMLEFFPASRAIISMHIKGLKDRFQF